jgi:excisionase family DNA binding protein
MSSNIQLKRVCQCCGKVFTARTTVTRCCSDACAKKLYKQRQRQSNIEQSNQDTRDTILVPTEPVQKIKPSAYVPADLIDVITLSAATGIGRTTLFRLMKEKGFPKIKIGRLVRFHKQTVIDYLINKYGNL